MRILVAEDDPKIASFLERGLQENGYAVDSTGDGEQALSLAMTADYDGAIVDLMLPGLDGLSIIERVRKERITWPIVVLSAKAGLDDRINCLQRGADDYVTKPFAFSELLARLQAVSRRSHETLDDSTFQIADLTLNRHTRQVMRGGAVIDLHPREFALLECLLRNKGRVLSKSYLLEKLWDCTFEPQGNVVDVLVCRLRNKVDKDFPTKLIQNLRGVGYVLKQV